MASPSDSVLCLTRAVYARFLPDTTLSDDDVKVCLSYDTGTKHTACIGADILDFTVLQCPVSDERRNTMSDDDVGRQCLIVDRSND